ncbi:MAG: BrnA antitoxin family protein [bacterium]
MKKKSNTDWKKLEEMTDEEIDFSDIPELNESFFENATLKFSKNKESVYIPVDVDLFNWFKHQGEDYKTRINAVLRLYIKAKKNKNRR